MIIKRSLALLLAILCIFFNFPINLLAKDINEVTMKKTIATPKAVSDEKTKTEYYKRRIASNGQSAYAYINSKDELYCWGENIGGVLGNGTTSDVSTPTLIMKDVKEVDMNMSRAIALKNDGSVWTWGAGNYTSEEFGGKGDKIPSKDIYAKPQQIKTLSEVEHVYSSGGYSYAILKNGVISQIKNESCSEGNSGFLLLKNSYNEMTHFELRNNGVLSADGSNACGEHGKQPYSGGNYGYTPNVISGVKDFDVGATAYGLCGAIKNNGDLYIWGALDSSAHHDWEPVKILSNISQMSMGSRRGVAVSSDGILYEIHRRSTGINGSNEIEKNVVAAKSSDFDYLFVDSKDNLFLVTAGTDSKRELICNLGTFDPNKIPEIPDKPGSDNPGVDNPDNPGTDSPEVPITDFYFEEEEYTLNASIDSSKHVPITIEPKEAIPTFLQWSSSDPTVASVSETGIIKPLNNGQTVITATTLDGKHSAHFTLNVINVGRGNEIIFGQDNFSFPNNLAPDLYPDDKYDEWFRNGYNNLNYTDRDSIYDEMEPRDEPSCSGGHCFGISVITVLNKMNLLNDFNLDSLKNQYAASSNRWTRALCDFYQYTQDISNIKTFGKNFRKQYKTDKERVLRLEELANQVKDNKSPLILSYQRWKGGPIHLGEESFGHTVVAYAVEKGNFTSPAKTHHTYNSKILIYDSNAEDTSKHNIYDDRYNLYYDDQTGDWEIPAYNNCEGLENQDRLISTLDCEHLSMAGNNRIYPKPIIENIMTASEFEQTGVKTKDPIYYPEEFWLNSQSINKNLNTPTEAGNFNSDLDPLFILNSETTKFSITSNTTGKKISLNFETEEYNGIDLDEIRVHNLNGENSSKIEISLSNDFKDSKIEAEGPIDFTLRTNSVLSRIKADAEEINVSLENGKVNLNQPKNQYEIKVTKDDYNENILPSYTVSSGSNSDVTITPTDKGINIDGENLKGTTIEGTNFEKTDKLTVNNETKGIEIDGSNETVNDGSTSSSKCIITVQANPANGGRVVGSGSFEKGKSVTVNATALPGYFFKNWTENGTEVSTDRYYTFILNSDRNLTANFIKTSSDPGPGSQSGVPIYRLYNERSGEHLYTSSKGEYDILIRDNGWTGENVGWNAPSTGDPVYRLYNPVLNDHLYTTSVEEMEYLTSSQGWLKDNNGQPLFYSGGSVAVYRLYNERTGRHHLTKSVEEYNMLPAYDWSQEGIKFYALSDNELNQNTPSIPTQPNNPSQPDKPSQPDTPSTDTPPISTADDQNVSYRAYLSELGWLNYVSNGETAGHLGSGNNYRMEAFEVEVPDNMNLNVAYTANVEKVGWQSYVNDGVQAGTTGTNQAVYGVKMHLTGSEAPNYDIYYRVYVSGSGWTSWVKNDQVAGTSGLNKDLEGLQIRISPKNK